MKLQRIPSVFVFALLGVGVVGLIVGVFLGVSGTWTMFMTDRFVASVEKNISSLREFEVYVYGIFDVPIYVTGHDERGNVKKLYGRFNPDVEMGESGDRIERMYYYDRGKLVYVYERVNPNPTGGEGAQEESRFYFKDGQMSVWLFGPVKEKKPRDSTFERQAADVLDTSEELLIAAAPRLAWIKREPIPLAQFLPGKSFYYTCKAGEQGVLKEDGTFPSSIPGEVNKGYDGGAWRLDGENIIISGSIISDGAYSDFIFEEKDGKIIAYYNPACGVVIGPDFESIELFLESRSYTYAETGETF